MTDDEIMRLVCRTAALSKRKRETPDGTKQRGYGHVLSALAGKNGMSQQEIADAVGIRPQSASEAIASLEERGFVERKPSADDRRKMLVFITDAGIEHSRVVAAERAERAVKLLSPLDDAEKAELERLLLKIVDENNINII